MYSNVTLRKKEYYQRTEEAKSFRSSLFCRASRERMPYSQADTTDATPNQIAS